MPMICFLRTNPKILKSIGKGWSKKKLDKIKTLAESPLPPPPPPRTLRHYLYDFHILHRPPPLNLD